MEAIVAVVIFVLMFALIILDKIPRHWITLGCAAATLLIVFGICMKSSAAITETREKYAAREEAAAAQAEEVTPAQSGPASPAEPAKRFILCPKCGERIWL